MDAAGLTIKELILRIEGKLDAFILSHEQRHALEATADQAARGDAANSPAGRAISARITEISEDVKTLSITVDSHERTLQRVVGALSLVSLLGVGTLGLVVLRIAGIVP